MIADSPSFSISVGARYGVLELADLNGDGIVDLIGGSSTDDAVFTALLDAEGKVSQEQSMPCGGNPKKVAARHLDDGPTLDIVTLCTRSSTGEFLIYHGNGDGTFEAAAPVPTIARPKMFDTGDVDRDGRLDIAVSSTKELAIHYGLEGGGFSEPALFDLQGAKNLKDVKIADADGDGLLDVLTGDSRLQAVLFYRGKGTREFEEQVRLDAGVRASLVEVVDVDKDGRLDLAVGDGGGRVSPSSSVSRRVATPIPVSSAPARR